MLLENKELLIIIKVKESEMEELLNQQVSININDLKTVACTCGKYIFTTVVLLKVIPAVYSQNGKPSLLQVQAMRCVECGATHMTDDIMMSISDERIALV